jgi:hypothetical protein
MARIFNIYFDYEGTTYSGMVTVRHTPFFKEFTLNFDEELMQLLPGNKIISTGPEKFIFQHATGQEHHPLARAIINAVATNQLPTEAK